MFLTKVKYNVYRTQEVALCIVRKWWRPLGCIGLVAAIFVNCIIIPLKKGEGVDLAGLALVTTSFAPIVAIREWGKIKAMSSTED